MTAHAAATPSLPVTARVVLDDRGQGLLSIRMVRDDGPAAGDAILLLRDALQTAAEREDTRAVLLGGLDAVFSGGGRTIVEMAIDAGLVEALAGFPWPLVAELPGDTRGAGLLLASLCDAMVCGEGARYGAAIEGNDPDAPTPAEHALAALRFGPVLADELLTAGAQTGQALQAKGWCCAVVPADRVALQAHDVAAQFLDKSRDSLRLLKAHLAAPLLVAARRLATAVVDPVDPVAVDLPKTLGRHLALRGHEGDVLTLTLRRGGKKHDVAAMAQDLHAAFAHASLRSGYRALVLNSEYPGFFPETGASDEDTLGFIRALREAPLPLVAIAGGPLDGRAWLALQACDAAIHLDDARLDASALAASPLLAGAAAELFARRLGTEVARDLLLGGTTLTGHELAQHAPAARSVPRADAMDAALDRARAWSNWPLASALAWSSVRANAIDAALAPCDEDASAEVAETPSAPTPSKIALASSVVAATSHPGGIVEVVMQDRASKNMLSPSLVEGMAEVFAHIATMPSCKAVVLTGYDTYFCSGGTKDALRAIQGGKVRFTDDRTFRLPLDCPVPVIAAMQGHGIGAGLSLGLFCDVPMLSAESHYVSPYMGYGFTPGVGATLIVPERFGQDLARETLLGAGEYEGCALQARGIPVQVHARQTVLDAAMALAARLARQPRASLVRMKARLNRSLHARLDAICAQEVAMHEATFVGRADTLAQIEASFGKGEEGSARSEPVPTPPAAPAPEPAAPVPRPPVEAVPLHRIRDTLMRLLAQELHLDAEDVDVDVQYTDLGLDSITGVTWMRKVNEAYGLSLDATIVYTYPTIARLAEHVKSLVDSRDLAQGTPDLAELQTRKLGGARDEAPARRGPTISLADAGDPASSPAPSVATAAAAPAAIAQVSEMPLTAIRDTLKRLLARELHLDDDEVDADRQYTDLGLDSITGVTWMRKVNEAYGLSLDATIVYTYPTIARLAEHVKSLVDSRDQAQGTPDLAELQTRKLRSFRDEDAPATSGRIALSAPEAPANDRLPVALASTTELAVAGSPSLPATTFRRLTSWRHAPVALPAGEIPKAMAPTVPADIAVIGMAGQFPMARDIDAFWENLTSGRDCIREVDPARWDVSAWYQSGEPAEGRTNSRWLGQLEDYDCFDPLFFNISPAEARSMDPQQRVFLEACWHGIEHAGYDPKSLGGSRCGVFVGAAGNDYALLSNRMRLSAHGFTGNAPSILAARIAYLLDLQGPCVTLDTACSASLVAIAAACDSLSIGTSDLALAGGVYVGAGPSMHIMTAQSGMLSTDGRCYSFDDRANGFVPGEAVGVVLLKRLADAERDGDIIHAVVRGWGMNQDGRTNGITAPNPASQTRLMQDVHRRHRIDPGEIQLIEAHGTGTPLGDPIEVRGLIDAFGKPADGTAYCALGSVKSNIGHCLTAAGVSAFMKAALAVAHRQLPPTIHFDRLNPHIRLEGSPFYVNTALQDWTPRNGARRHVGVSAFGYSGTNAHVVLAEHTPGPRATPSHLPSTFIVPLSAKTPAQLVEIARNLLAFLRRAGDDVILPDLAWTLQVGRTAMEERAGFVVASLAQLAERLEAYVDGRRDMPDFSAGQIQKNRESLSLIDQDEEFKQELLERWMGQKKYAQLLRLWAKGMALDWSRLYGATKPRRIVLPTYPFARERYWVDAEETASVLSSPVAASPQVPALPELPSLLFFEERWVEQPAPVAPSNDDDAASVVLIAPADTGWTLPNALRIDDVDGVVAAVERARAADGRPVAVVCAAAAGRQAEGIHLLFDLFAKLRPVANAVRDVLLVGVYDPTTPDGLWDASWVGFERSLRTLMPALRVSLLLTDDRTSAGLHVANALRTGGVVSYRNERRHVLSLDRAPAPAASTTAQFKQHGHYLITGGCGALGGLFARHLAETCQARLTLVGRRPHSEAIEAQLVALRAAGARAVAYASLDIADADAVAAWGRTLPEPLTGVIHAAGVSHSRPFHEKPAAEIDSVLGPKTTATIALDEALRDQPLDLVCYCSSSSAMLGDGGACDYAIANRFLLEYSRWRAQARRPGKTVVVHWPLWEKAADGTGMGPEDAAKTAFYLRSSGQSALPRAEGLALWQALLGEPRVQTLVMHGQPSRIGPFLDRLYGVATAPVSVKATATSPAASPVHAGDWRATLRAQVRAIVAATMEMPVERLDDDTNLADYGFDSISLTTLAKDLQSGLSVEVTPALFFNRGNVAGLVEHFADQHAEHFAARHRDAAAATDATPEASAPIVAPVASMPAPTLVPVVRAAGEGIGPIAIVGISGRFPKADDVDALWSLLSEGRTGIDDVPASRWDWRDYFIAPGDRRNRVNARCGGFLDGMDTFDPLFFEVSPAEAEEMDPAERLLMMESYRAFEDAGIAPASLRGRSVGVFVGMEESQYSLVTEAPGVTTLGAAMISSRLSYFLDLRGPALATNTACSSGLVAFHQAVGSLQQGECETALVASVSLSLSPKPWMKMSEAGMLSPDGLCRAFSKHADGIGIGEAVVAVVLAPLSTALAQGLPVYGVVRGSGTNFDGKTNGVTAPNGRAQEQLIETVYTRHGIDAGAVSHVIAHGTGTRLGDPVELNALHNAFRTLASHAVTEAPALPCAVTSVKGNLGHTMAASGLVSLAALVQGLVHRRIPASLHCEEDNDYIAWRDSRLYINKTTRDWDVPAGRTRLGAVSAFGRSGTNAHVVIEEFRDPRTVAAAPAVACIVPLSARTGEQLRQQAEALLAHLDRTQEADVAAIARTLQDGRDAHAHRLAVIADSSDTLRVALQGWLAGRASDRVFAGKAGWRDDASQTAIASGHASLSATASAWANGARVDWSAHRDVAVSSRPRLHLPTYPFARDRYWIEAAPVTQVAPVKAPAPRRASGSLEAILDQVDAGVLEGGDAVAALKALAGEAR